MDLLATLSKADILTNLSLTANTIIITHRLTGILLHNILVNNKIDKTSISIVIRKEFLHFNKITINSNPRVIRNNLS